MNETPENINDSLKNPVNDLISDFNYIQKWNNLIYNIILSKLVVISFFKLFHKYHLGSEGRKTTESLKKLSKLSSEMEEKIKGFVYI